MWEQMQNISRLDGAIAALTEAVLATEEYQTYEAVLAKVKQYPELKKQIDDFRKRNFELQLSSDNDLNKLDQFEKEFESLREDMLVQDFLAAELDLCRLIQDIYLRITAALHFE